MKKINILELILLVLFIYNQAIALTFTNQDCLNCHENMLPKIDMKTLEKSVHSSLNCISCHSDAITIPHKMQLQSVNCANCHPNEVEQIAKGSHGNPNKTGLPTCKICHGTHDIYTKENSSSKISFSNVSNTCGMCHQNILNEYKNSTHGMLLNKGNKNVPVCTTCHGEHNIKWIDRIGLYGIETKECGNCHLDKSKTYQDSYHGRATFGGFIRAALCTDCHGKHLILPKDDPNSTINNKNIDNTCGKCHGLKTPPSTNAKPYIPGSIYGKYQIHTSLSQIFIFKVLFLAIIILALLGFLIHYIIIGPKRFDEEEKIYWFTLFNRLIHFFVAISFVVLIITGLIIIFADFFGGGSFILISRYIHRFCAFFFIPFDILMMIMWYKYFTIKKYDFKWLMVLGGYLSKKKKVVPADKFNFGQKIWFIFSTLSGIVMFITGLIIMLLPPNIQLLKTSIYLHNIFAILLVSFFMIHLYMSIFLIKGSIKTMITGYKSKEEAEIMHGFALNKEKKLK